jgi:hypothetical protein
MPKEPLEIVVKAEDRLVGYACGECGALFLLQKNDKTEKDQAYWKNEALAHCARNCACGNPLGKYYRLVCNDCQAKKDEEREAARFEKAHKIEIGDYDGPVFYGDEYFSDIDSLLDHFESEGLELPLYVWATTPQKFELKADDIVVRELEKQNMHEDANNHISEKAIISLRAYLEAWSKEVDLVSYFEDNSRAVLLRPDDVDAAS